MIVNAVKRVVSRLWDSVKNLFQIPAVKTWAIGAVVCGAVGFFMPLILGVFAWCSLSNAILFCDYWRLAMWLLSIAFYCSIVCVVIWTIAYLVYIALFAKTQSELSYTI